MLPPPPVVRLASPALPGRPPRAPFPLAATLAPVIVSVGIWAVTGSPYSLLFAALGPVVAVGGLVDGRRQRRRSARADRTAALASLERTRARIDQLHEAERRRLTGLAPGPAASVEPVSTSARWASVATEPMPVAVRIGLVDLPPVVELDPAESAEPPADSGDEVGRLSAALREAAARVPGGPRVVDACDGIGVTGPGSLGRSVARALALQVAAAMSPASVSVVVPPDEEWVRRLPHATSTGRPGVYRFEPASGEAIVIAWADRDDDLPPLRSEPVRLGDRESAPTFIALSDRRADQLADRLRGQAEELGILVAARAIPDSVDLAGLLAQRPDDDGGAPGLRAPIGLGADGVVELDLVRDGPHAVVAGTTGTGKSELLVSWVLAMAARHPPEEATFLLVDFKGGAAFAPLVDLPHVVGIVSDLDARRSRRAIESLRAELLRREGLLAERGARSIDDLARDGGAPARLVIVVDEFAAVVAGQPELHEVFADLASRGRSLGLHLVLCTQRPAGVIRDGVLANVTLRISLRVIDRGDSIAMLDADAAARLPLEPRGRAVIADGSGVLREVQLAIAGPRDAERVRFTTSSSRQAARVWCEPLPDRIPLADLRSGHGDAAAASGVPFGLLDLPAEQRQPVAHWDPVADGHLLVLGGARSGVTNALAVIADGARARLLPRDPADAWSVVDDLERRGQDAPGVVVVDDLDVLIDRFDPDLRQEFVERLGRLARASHGVRLVVGARQLTGPLARIAGAFPSRLLLRQPHREEHVLAGGDAASYDPRIPPGSGTWNAAVVQVAVSDVPLSAPVVPVLPRVAPAAGGVLAVVASRSRELRRRWEGVGVRVVVVGETSTDETAALLAAGILAAASPSSAPTVLIGDGDAWQADWNLLAAVRREHPLVFFGCTASELRAVARLGTLPPPLGADEAECWLVEGGDVRRALFEF